MRQLGKTTASAAHRVHTAEAKRSNEVHGDDSTKVVSNDQIPKGFAAPHSYLEEPKNVGTQ